jgi:hypothetical protein
LKKWLILSLVAMFLITITGSAFAWSGNLMGQPYQFHQSGPKRYYIWRDDHGFHLWTTTRGEEHVFSGVIHTDGTFKHVRGHSLEDGDSFNTYEDIQEKHWFDFSAGDRETHFAFGGREVNMENDKIHFKFDTNGGSDGINFHTQDASFVTFDLFVDGHPVPAREIHIGHDGWHPDDHHFRLNQ